MAATMDPIKIGDAIMAFAINGRFPEDADTLPPVSGTDLQPAIESLNQARAELEAEIHQINEETKDDVSLWAKNAKSLQEDIIRSKTMANEITRQSEAPDVSGEAILDAEEKVVFINREVQYSQQLHEVLRSIKRVTGLQNQAEQALAEKRVLESLRFLEESWAALDNVNAARSSRVMRLLDLRAFELKSAAYQVFNQIWKSMVNIDVDACKITIRDTSEDGKMALSDAVIGLKAYKEVDERLEQLWHNLDTSIISPRMDHHATSLRSISTTDDELSFSGPTDRSINSLLTDLETVFLFVAKKLPADLLPNFSAQMVADVIPKLIDNWLNAVVPSSLQNMDTFQHVIQRTQEFCARLSENGYTGLERISTWAEKAPMTWLGKCRDTALDGVRNRLAGGIGDPKKVEKIERHMVTVAEGKELATTGAGAAADTADWNEDWGDAWNEEEPSAEVAQETEDTPMQDDDGADAWASWGESADDNQETTKTDPAEDDGADAWGWDEGAAAQPEPEPKPTPAKTVPRPRPQANETRELILKETYSISSMPEPVLELIFSILEDGMALTKEDGEYSLVAGTAAGLFGLPTFALALFRAISPHYYSLVMGGNMYLYNDAMYLAEKLGEFSANWKEREDVTARAKAMLRLENDIKTLQSFANRSYTAEMSIQRTVLQDLLGDSQSLLQQDEMEAAVEAGTTRIRTMASTWEPILARSVWSQAIGSLADTMATRLINDVLELSSIGQDEAYNIARLISAATALDDLFLPSKLGDTAAPPPPPADGDEVPATAQYAPHWLRLKYLSEVLQSNLNEVRYLWCDSELSLYFTVDEVVDLIKASFEDNARTRDTIREIRAKQPLSA